MENEQTRIIRTEQILEISNKLGLSSFRTSYLIELHNLCKKCGLELTYNPQNDDAPDLFRIMRPDVDATSSVCCCTNNDLIIVISLLRLLTNTQTTQLDQLEQRIAALERKASTAHTSGTTRDTTHTKISDEKFAALTARARDIGNFLENTGGRIRYHRHWRYAISPDGTKKSYFTVQDALMKWPHSSPYWYFKPDDSYELSRLEKFIEHDEKLYQIMQEKRSKEEK